jgi:hypothetical protein
LRVLRPDAQRSLNLLKYRLFPKGTSQKANKKANRAGHAPIKK